jgi:hypothetical protein
MDAVITMLMNSRLCVAGGRGEAGHPTGGVQPRVVKI